MTNFNRVGKFGCGQCYETFNSEIDPLLQRIQGSSEYEGTVPVVELMCLKLNMK